MTFPSDKEPTTAEIIARAKKWNRVAKVLAIVAIALALAGFVVALLEPTTYTITIRP